MSHIPWPEMRRSLVAILRGIKPEETEAIVSVLIDAGFTAIEIPLNSPDPFQSISLAAKLAPKNVLIGAGTVLTIADVDRLHSVGGTLMVSPNVVPAVIERANGHGMVTMPGVFSPTEALSAVAAGASGLKFFPANVLGATGISAMKAVLPSDIAVGAVGGVSEKDFATYGKAGVKTFGLGSSLYKPGYSAQTVKERAELTIAAYDAAFGN